MGVAIGRSPHRQGVASRGLRGLWIGLGCLLLVLLFTLLQFPWDRLRPWIIEQLRATTGAEFELTRLDLGLSLRGPTATCTGLTLRWPGSPTLVLDRAEIAPALSLSWLRGAPALAVQIELADGVVEGTLWPSSEPAFDGGFENLDLAALPLAPEPEPLPLDGSVSGRADVVLQRGRWVGALRVHAVEGSLVLPGFPLAIPFDQLAVDLDLGPDGRVAVRKAEIEGPMVSAVARGALGPAPRLQLAPLDLEVELRAMEPALADPLRGQGISVDETGRASFRVEGTGGRPLIR